MDADRQRINLLVGEKYFPLTVLREDEPLYRKAAQSVNERLNKYKDKYRGNNTVSILDLMSITALDVAVTYMKQDTDSNAKMAETDLLKLIEDLQAFMNCSGEAFDLSD